MNPGIAPRQLRSYNTIEELREEMKRAPKGCEITEAEYAYPMDRTQRMDGRILVVWEPK